MPSTLPGPGPQAPPTSVSCQIGETKIGFFAPGPFVVYPPQANVDAGLQSHVRGCGWFGKTGCSMRVHLTLKVGGKSYALAGKVDPTGLFVGFSAPYVGTSDVEGDVTVPDIANLTHNPLPGMVIAKQTVRVPLIVCVDVGSHQSQFPVTVQPAASDSTVIVGVTPQQPTQLQENSSVTISWQQTRAGEIQIRFWYALNDRLGVSVKPNGGPLLDQQRPAGLNTFTLPLKNSGGVFPAGRYGFEIRLLDPQGSGTTPAAPKSGAFSVIHR